MTYEEAIKELKTSEPTPEVLKMVYEAMEKQVPKEPKRVSHSFFGDREEIYCPSCGINFSDKEFGNAYCDCCGQRLIWEETR